MNYCRILFLIAILFSACVNRGDIKKEIADFHACVTKCDDIESTNTFNFYKCSQSCIDLYEQKKIVLHKMDPGVWDKGMSELNELRNQGIEKCQEQVVTVKTQVREEIKRCKEICIYNLKK